MNSNENNSKSIKHVKHLKKKPFKPNEQIGEVKTVPKIRETQEPCNSSPVLAGYRQRQYFALVYKKTNLTGAKET